MSQRSQSNNRLLTLLTGCFVLGVYFPYILKGGWTCDDWMIVDHLQSHPGFWDYVCSWFPIFSARPLAPLILAAIARAYDKHPAYYVVSQCFLLGLSWITLSLAWRRLCGVAAGTVFLILVFLPSVASTLVFSPGMQHLAAVSYLLWTSSFVLHEKALRGSGSWVLLTFSGVLLFLGMLLYEIFLPLLVFQCFMPFFLSCGNARSAIPVFRTCDGASQPLGQRPQSDHPATRQRYGAFTVSVITRFDRLDFRPTRIFMASLPVVLAVFFGLMFQKIIVPLFLPDMSRLTPGGPGMMVRTFAYWLFAVTVQTPLLWADALSRLPEAWDGWSLVTFFGLVVVLFMTYRKDNCAITKDRETGGHQGSQREAQEAQSGEEAIRPTHRPTGLSTDCNIMWLRRVSFLAMLLSVMLFVLSGSYAAVYGNDNRKFSSLWVATSLWLSTFWTGPPKMRCRVFRSYYGILVGLAIAFANTSSFLLQRNNYLIAWRAQLAILSTIRDNVRQPGNGPIPPGSVVLAAVPPVVPGNHNDECVFTRSWDIASALRWATDGRVSDAVALYPWLAVQGRTVLEDTRLSVDGLWEVDVKEKPVYFFGCELEHTPPRGLGAFWRRSIGDIGGLRAVTRVNLQPITNGRALVAAVKRATLELNRHLTMSLPARTTQEFAEWVRRHVLGKEVPPISERLFHPTIIEKGTHSTEE